MVENYQLLQSFWIAPKVAVHGGAGVLLQQVRTRTLLEKSDLVFACAAQGAKAIAEGLSVNRNLTWLGMGKNFLGVEGAWALSDGLRANRGLQWLAVGSNSIGDRGATHLATLLSGKM